MGSPDKILNNLKVSGNLPSMPQILVHLIDACHEAEVDLRKIAAIIEKDAALTAKILQLVNSAFIGARTPFSNLQQAVVYLGASTVKNLAISVSVQQVFRRVETNGLLSIDRFWHHSYQNAILCQRLAVAVEYPEPSDAYLAGLLHDIGKLLLWMAFPGRYAPLLLKGVRCHNARLAFLEQEKLHVNHCEAGAWLMEQWRLPAIIADAIRFHHHPVDEATEALPLVRITHLADLLSHCDQPDDDCRKASAAFFHFDPDKLASLLEGVDDQIQEVADNLGIRIPARSRSMLDQEPESETVHKETSIGLINRIRDITQLHGVLDNLAKSENLEQVIATVEKGLKILFNEDACLLLLPDASGRELRCQVSRDSRLARDAGAFRFELARHGASLVGQAWHQRQLLHSFQEKNRHTINLLDRQIQHLMATDGIAVVPMVHGSSILGLLVVGLTQAGHAQLLSHASPLLLLARHAAISLHQENLKRQQSELIVSERLASASLLARQIAHEINNPLGILRNYIKILSLKTKEREDIQHELSIIDGELERIGLITSQLKDLGSADQCLHREMVDVRQILKELVQFFRMTMPADRQIKIELAVADDTGSLLTDANHLRQIIINLLTNALDALGDRGTIRLAALRQEDKVSISVSDDGPGIPEDLMPDLFKAGTSSKSGNHSGLGLAIVDKHVHDLNGTISCRNLESGTIFSISLPAKQ